MKTYKIIGSNFEVTFSAYSFQAINSFGRLAYSFIRDDGIEVYSIPCAGIRSIEVLI